MDRRDFLKIPLAAQLAAIIHEHYPSHSIQLLESNPTRIEGFRKYERDPVAYAWDCLGVRFTRKQQEAAYLLTTSPYKVLVRAGHNVGKSLLSAVLTSWWYDIFNPGFCLTTAPTQRQVHDILWKYVRVLRANAKDPRCRGGWVGPKIPRLESAPNHYAYGFTAKDGDRFQGHHDDAVLIIFDEAVGVAPIFWQAMQTMLGGHHYGFLAIYNPTDQSSSAHREERAPGYHPVVTMSCLDHPNIKAAIARKPIPIQNAITYGTLHGMLERWATRIDAADKNSLDIAFTELGNTPDLDKVIYYRPGPVAEARLLGRWPTQSVNAVWTEFAIDQMLNLAVPHHLLYSGPLQIGVDVARYGDDFTAIHVRKGGTSLWHESHNGWGGDQIIGRLESLAAQFAKQFSVAGPPNPAYYNRPLWAKENINPREIPIVVDDDGIGGIVVNVGRKEGFNFLGVSNASIPIEPLNEDYPNIRSWLWFSMVACALQGNCTLKILAKECPQALQQLRDQLLGPTYHLDPRGRRVVEKKEDMKARGLSSPDDADGFNLAYLAVSTVKDRVIGQVRVPSYMN